MTSRRQNGNGSGRRQTSPRVLSRRAVLRGMGTAVALPFLEALPILGSAGPRSVLAAGSTAAAGPPTRLAFFFVPNGVHLPDWKPKQEGPGFDLPFILEPLANVRDDVLVLSGLTHDKGRANGDGAGDHARSASVFLTGAQPVKTSGANFRSGISADQLAAQAVGDQTRFASLELGIEGGRNSGNCDSGYSCAYSNNISWRSPTTPMAKEIDPRAVFERLFASDARGEVDEARARKERRRLSILDFVLEDARRLQGKLGATDRRKLDEYLTGVREIEHRLERVERVNDQPEIVQPANMPEAGESLEYEEHLRLMGDMMVLAFQGDVTRVATMMYASAGSNRNYRQIGVPDGHHQLSHHQGRPENHAKIRKINRFHIEQLAYFLERLKAIPEGDGTLLDHCAIMYGSGISDGNRHNNEDLPVLLAGRAGGTIDTGRHVVYDYETPVCNLLLSMVDRVGAHPDALGDSTGRLRDLTV